MLVLGPIAVLMALASPASAEVRAVGFVLWAPFIAAAQWVEWNIMSKQKERGYDRRIPLSARVEEDVQEIQHSANMWLSYAGDSSAFRSSDHVAERLESLKSTALGRAALDGLLEDDSPVVRLFAAEAVVGWDLPTARLVATDILAEPRYFDWILERAASDLTRWAAGAAESL